MTSFWDRIKNLFSAAKTNLAPLPRGGITPTGYTSPATSLLQAAKPPSTSPFASGYYVPTSPTGPQIQLADAQQKLGVTSPTYKPTTTAVPTAGATQVGINPLGLGGYAPNTPYKQPTYNFDTTGGNNNGYTGLSDVLGGYDMGTQNNQDIDWNSMVNQTMAGNGQDPFNLENKSNEQLNSILNTIQEQMNAPKNQTSYLDLLKQAREAAGLPAIQGQLSGVEGELGKLNQAYKTALAGIETTPGLTTFQSGRRQQALDRSASPQIGELTAQQQTLQSQLGQANDLASQYFGAAGQDLQTQNELPGKQLDTLSKIMGIQSQQMQIAASQASLPIQQKLAQLELLAKQQELILGNTTDPLAQQKTLAEIAKIKAETQKMLSEASGTGGNLTQAQYTMAGFVNRMANSDQIINDLGNKFVGWESYIGGVAPNIFKSEDRQKYEQAERDFVNAKLRQESGAAISPSEFDSAIKQYFPQPGDSQAVIEQKARNRAQVIQDMQRQAGGAYTGSSGLPDSQGLANFQ